MIRLRKYFIISLILYEVTSQYDSSNVTFRFPKNNNAPNPKYRIIGGTVVDPPNRYPFQAALLIQYSGSRSLCGGSLVADEWVLTAAHCVDGRPLSVSVILGAHNLQESNENSRQTFRSNNIFIHQQWDLSTYTNDIALIKLPEKAKINENVQVVDFARGSDLYTGQFGTILGWGLTETGYSSNLLLQVDVDILSNSKCYSIVKPTHLCTSGVGIKGSCNGDSGGPLIVDNVLVGIVSFGPEDCTLGLPSVFTRVTSYHNWISYTMENGVAPNGRGSKLHISYMVSIVVLLSLYI